MSCARWAGLLVLVGLVGVSEARPVRKSAAPARARPVATPMPTTDPDEAAARRSDYWDRVLDPAATRTGQLVEAARARAHARPADLSAARTFLDQALSLDPNHVDGRTLRGQLRQQAGDFAGCADDLTVAMATRTEASPVQTHLDCLLRAGRFADAARWGQAAIDAGHPGAAGYRALGEANLALDRVDRAAVALEQAQRRAIGSELPSLRWALVLAYDRGQRTGDAARLANEAYVADRTLTRIDRPGLNAAPAGDRDYTLALAAIAAGALDRATIYWRAFLEAAPSSRWRALAEAHLASALAGRDRPERVVIGGNYAGDPAVLKTTVVRWLPRARACLQATPDIIVEVDLRTDPGAPARRWPRIDTKLGFARTVVPSGAPPADVVRCLNDAAAALAPPRLTGDQWVLVRLRVSAEW